VVVFSLWTASVARAGASNSLLDISADGQLLACTNRDSGTVTLVNLSTHTKLREIQVGAHPEGVSFLGSSHHLAVAVYADDKIVFLDGDSGERLGNVDVFDEPYGVVSSADGKRVFVTLDYPGRIVEIDAHARTITREIAAGQFVRGIAISNDDKRLFISEYYTTAIKAIDVATGQAPTIWRGK
jgi:YVTN family beta-propeller protein